MGYEIPADSLYFEIPPVGDLNLNELLLTLHLNRKNLLNNSSWDFEPIFDTRNSCGLCPSQKIFSNCMVFLVNPGEVKLRPLKQTKTQNGHHFFTSTFHN